MIQILCVAVAIPAAWLGIVMLMASCLPYRARSLVRFRRLLRLANESGDPGAESSLLAIRRGARLRGRALTMSIVCLLLVGLATVIFYGSAPNPSNLKVSTTHAKFILAALALPALAGASWVGWSAIRIFREFDRSHVSDLVRMTSDEKGHIDLRLGDEKAFERSMISLVTFSGLSIITLLAYIMSVLLI